MLAPFAWGVCNRKNREGGGGVAGGSYCLRAARTRLGPAAMLLLCSGVEGYADGALCAASVARLFAGFFEQTLPGMIEAAASADELLLDTRDVLGELLQRANRGIRRHAAAQQGICACSLLLLFIVDKNYLAMNVGDVRLYVQSAEGLQLLLKEQLAEGAEDASSMVGAAGASGAAGTRYLREALGAKLQLNAGCVMGRCAAGDVFAACGREQYKLAESAEFAQLMAELRFGDAALLQLAAEQLGPCMLLLSLGGGLCAGEARSHD